MRVLKIVLNRTLAVIATILMVIFSAQYSLMRMSFTSRMEQCTTLKFSEKLLPLVVLTSYPGSGNTWVRHLIQQGTGIYTGSVYCDKALRDNGFPGECARNRTVVVVKNHKTNDMKFALFNAVPEKAILVIRNPFNAFKAYYNFRDAGHTGIGSSPMKGPEWEQWVENQITRWSKFHLYWLTEYDKPLCVIRYENLQNDLENQVQKMCSFLGYEPTRGQLQCIADHATGNFKRNKSSTEDPFTQSMREDVDEAIRAVETAIRKFDDRYCALN